LLGIISFYKGVIPSKNISNLQILFIKELFKINKIRNEIKLDKLKFTINELNKLKIKYDLKNIKTGQINIKIKNNLIVYYSNTDKILLNNCSLEKRGLIQLIKVINSI
jgi:hypothetical protein